MSELLPEQALIRARENAVLSVLDLFYREVHRREMPRSAFGQIPPSHWIWGPLAVRVNIRTLRVTFTWIPPGRLVAVEVDPLAIPRRLWKGRKYDRARLERFVDLARARNAKADVHNVWLKCETCGGKGTKVVDFINMAEMPDQEEVYCSACKGRGTVDFCPIGLDGEFVP